MTDEEDEFSLVTAAGALEAALRRFRELIDRADQGPLSTRKQLERTAKSLSDLADADTEVGERAKELVEAIVRSRKNQESLAARAQERALELQSRSNEFQGLMDRLGLLGQEAHRLNGEFQGELTQERMAGVCLELDGLVLGARDLSEQAGSRGFDDV
jgi:chromosome segregation ATPase